MKQTNKKTWKEEKWIDPLERYLSFENGTAMARRGRAYAAEGRVLKVDLEAVNAIMALVQGSEDALYEVELFLDKGMLISDCSCPVGYYCKHGYALALVLAGEANRRGREWARVLVPYLPDQWKKGKWTGLEHLSEHFEAIFGDSQAAPTTDPAPAKGESSGWWHKYLATNTAYDQQQMLVEVVRKRVGKHQPYWLLDTLARRLQEIPGPIDRLRHFESKLADFARQNRMTPLPPDPGLQAFLDSPQVGELEKELDRKQMERDLQLWLEPDVSAGGEIARIDLVWLVAPAESADHLPQLRYQVLLTSKKLRREPRGPQAIEQLHRDVDNGRRRFSPDEKRLIRWLITRGYVPSHIPYLASPEEASKIRVRNVLEWLSMWSRLGWPAWADGGRVVLSPQSARVTLAKREDGEAVWAVGFGPDRTVPLNQVNLVCEEGTSSTSWLGYKRPEGAVFVLEGDVLWPLETGDMPHRLLAIASRLPEAPVRQLRNTPAGHSLAQRLHLPVAPSAEAGFLAEVPVHVTVECRAASRGRVAVSALAQDGSGCQWHWVENRWALAERTATPSYDDDVELLVAEAQTASSLPDQSQDLLAAVPREADVAPVDDWFREIATRSALVTGPAGGAALEWRIKGAEALDLIEWWSRRPAGVTYMGNRAFRELVELGRVPRITVKAEPSGVDWLKMSVEMERDAEALSLADITAALESWKEQLVMLPSGRLYNREELEEYRRTVEALGAMGLDMAPGEQRMHAMQLAAAGSDALEAFAESQALLREVTKRIRSLVRTFKELPKASVPVDTASFLRPYQRTGADFLVWAAQNFGGALLADDMGLGKTLQTLAALSALKQKESGPALVVCPASVAHNWKREAERFTPALRVLVLESGKERKHLLEHLDDYDLVIKNYALARRDFETLQRYEWLAVCVDEAQNIKNPAADITRTMKSLNARYRFALTGTPLENRLTDLWSIVDFVVPGYLQTQSRFEQRVKKDDPGLLARTLRAKLRPILLRRLKSEVAPELPPRIEERRDCEMVASQKKAYLAEVQRVRLLLGGMKGKQGKAAAQERIRMLAALTRLRQIACDPALVDLPDKGSGKTKELHDLLPPILEAGHKILLFSQFVKMLKRIEATLKKAGIPTYILTGETKRRQDLVTRFESDPSPSVFLISLKAGGTGLNLPSASHVILFDPWWNPAVEAQAIDRTHRIGQDKTVLAFRLVAIGTVEERILELQERKRATIKTVLEEEAFNRSLTQEDFEYLLSEPDATA